MDKDDFVLILKLLVPTILSMMASALIADNLSSHGSIEHMLIYILFFFVIDFLLIIIIKVIEEFM